MSWSHVVLEGICSLDTDEEGISKKDYSCAEYAFGLPGPHCISYDKHIKCCKHFSWCAAENYLVMTNEDGLDLACTSYEPEHAKAIEDFIGKIRASQDELD